MKSQHSTPGRARAHGFSLILTLIILSAVVVLVIGLFTMSVTEKQVSSSFDAVEQADLAVDAGFAKATTQLMSVTSRDDFQICLVSDPNATDANGRTKDYLVARSYDETQGQWFYTPLVSGAAGPITLDAKDDPFQGIPLATKSLAVLLDPNNPKFKPGPRFFDAKGNPDGSEVNDEANPQSGTPPPADLFNGQPGKYLPPYGPQSGLPKTLPWQVKNDPTQPKAPAVPYLTGAAGSPVKPKIYVYWEQLRQQPGNRNSTLMGRYCYQIEDLQGEVNLGTAGNSDGDPVTDSSGNKTGSTYSRETFTASSWPLPVPGLNLKKLTSTHPLLSQAALFTLADPAALDDTAKPGTNLADNLFTKARFVQFSPDLWKQMLIDNKSFPTDLFQRDAKTGRLPTASSSSASNSLNTRALEESSVAGIRSYKELALIPQYPGFVISPGDSSNPDDPKGLLKRNLNKYLKEVESSTDLNTRDVAAKLAVSRIATFIHTHLPNFENRGGGYPLGTSATDKPFNYLQSVAAGIIDYADTDSLPTLIEGQYRGMDSFPIVNEHWERLRFENVIDPDPNDPKSKDLIFSVTTYLELWNCTNRPISGQVKASLGYNPAIVAKYTHTLQDILNGAGGAPAHQMTLTPNGSNQQPDKEENNTWYYPAVNVADPDNPNNPLPPNGYQVVAFPSAWFKFVVGKSDFINPIEVNEDSTSQYKLKFMPQGATDFMIVDEPHGKIDCADRKVYYPGTSSNPGQKFNTNLPGEDFTIDNIHFVDNISDSRMAYFLGGTTINDSILEQINYGHGSSPGVRNLRYDSSSDATMGSYIYGVQNISQWPDAGHNTFIPDTNATALRPYRVKTTNDGNDVNPDDPTLAARAKAARQADPNWSSKFVQRLSNAGKYYSVTELGNIYDPICWDPGGASADKNPDKWKDYKDLGKSSVASASQGGGNSLRIGRPEHSRFRPDYSTPAQPWRPTDRGYCATALLDLFHCGILTPQNCAPVVDANGANSSHGTTFDSDLLGDFVKIDGHVNLNTATRDALRSLMAGKLVNDPMTAAAAPPTTSASASPVTASALYPPHAVNNTNAVDYGLTNVQANYLADLIIQRRPFLSPAEVPERVTGPVNIPAFGNYASNTTGAKLTGVYANSNLANTSQVEWNDAAMEETFARLYNNSTVRSRNFRILVTGQALRTTRSGNVEVLSTRSRVYHVFIKPVQWENTGSAASPQYTGKVTRQQVQITYERPLY